MEYLPLASSVVSGAAGIERAPAAENTTAQVRALAQQFEAMLLTQMLRDMKESMSPESDRAGLGGPILGDTMNTELGAALSRSGGVGLADVLMRALKAYDTAREKSDIEAAAPAAVTTQPEQPRDAILTMPPAGVTSDYGWRADPISGRSKFHAGVDLRYAYGQDVHAAAGGVVTFAGDQGGYGTTVVIDHGNGFETRYAHLSAIEVQQGSAVGAGATIARSGNSGRSTGPHLHFEVRQDGRRVDPQSVAAVTETFENGGSAAGQH